MDGFCQCGCGEKTALSKYTDRPRGYVKGEPMRYISGHNGRRSSVDYIEEDRGHDTPCWVWQRYINKRDGYGYRKVAGTPRPAHRLYYEEHIGPIPKGLHIDHLCRVRSCVNPGHLEPVTNARNVQRGDCAKLTRDQVIEIRRSSATNKELASAYGVDHMHISRIRNGRKWRDMEGA